MSTQPLPCRSPLWSIRIVYKQGKFLESVKKEKLLQKKKKKKKKTAKRKAQGMVLQEECFESREARSDLLTEVSFLVRTRLMT